MLWFPPVRRSGGDPGNICCVRSLRPGRKHKAIWGFAKLYIYIYISVFLGGRGLAYNRIVVFGGLYWSPIIDRHFHFYC